mgnify:CR=1 FL=1
MTKSHRASIAYFAMKYELLNEGKFSFIQKINKESLLSIIKHAIPNPINEYIEQVEAILPYELDTHELSQSEKSHFGVTNNKKDWYSDTYINLVTETFFGKTRQFTTSYLCEHPVYKGYHLCFDLKHDPEVLFDDITNKSIVAILGYHYHFLHNITDTKILKKKF